MGNVWSTNTKTNNREQSGDRLVVFGGAKLSFWAGVGAPGLVRHVHVTSPWKKTHTRRILAAWILLCQAATEATRCGRMTAPTQDTEARLIRRFCFCLLAFVKRRQLKIKLPALQGPGKCTRGFKTNPRAFSNGPRTNRAK